MQTQSFSAYLLVSHGSRDPRPGIAMEQLAGMLQEKLQSINHKQTVVGTAFLELTVEPLHEQIIKFAQKALVAGCDNVKILPLFLLEGVHVMEDIPQELAQAQMAVGGDIEIELLSYLGFYPALGQLLTKQIIVRDQERRILIAHGSRRPASQQRVETIAAKLGAVPAYWHIPPSLEMQVKELIAVGAREIVIFPYFLFSGGITDAIALSVEGLRLQFPTVSFRLAEPLGASPELADIIWDCLQR
jgi:sirohydrochlorin cobaltochelatase